MIISDRLSMFSTTPEDIKNNRTESLLGVGKITRIYFFQQPLHIIKTM